MIKVRIAASDASQLDAGRGCGARHAGRGDRRPRGGGRDIRPDVAALVPLKTRARCAGTGL